MFCGAESPCRIVAWTTRPLSSFVTRENSSFAEPVLSSRDQSGVGDNSNQEFDCLPRILLLSRIELMMSKRAFRVIHVCPHSARLSGGHTNAIITFMESQLHHGMDVCGICPADSKVPAALKRPIEHLPIREIDFETTGFCATALQPAAGAAQALFHFHGYIKPFVPLSQALAKAGIPYVFTSQGQLHYRGPIHWFKKAVYLHLVVPFFKKAGGLHFVTGREMERCRFLLPSQGRPVLVHHNVICVPDPATVSSASRANLTFRPRPSCSFTSGRLHIEHKGVDLLVRGFAKLPANDNVWLALVGPDWENGKRRLEQLANELWLRRAHPVSGPAVWG